jgi:hypothetical protein
MMAGKDVMFGGMLRCWKNADDCTYHAVCTHLTPHPFITQEEMDIIPKYTHIPPDIILPLLYKKIVESVHSYQSCSCRGDCMDAMHAQIQPIMSTNKVFRAIWSSTKPMLDVHIHVSIEESVENCNAVMEALLFARLHPECDKTAIVRFVESTKSVIIIEQEGRVVLKIGCSYVDTEIAYAMITHKAEATKELRKEMHKYACQELCTTQGMRPMTKEQAIEAMREMTGRKK